MKRFCQKKTLDMVYTITNPKNNKIFYLHRKKLHFRSHKYLYFFSLKKEGAIKDFPENYMIVWGCNNGMPLMKRINYKKVSWM